MASTLAFGTGVRDPYFDTFRAPNYVNSMSMPLASSANSVTIPAGMQFMKISASNDIYINWKSTGVSTGAAADGTASEFVPAAAGYLIRNIGSSLGTTAISIMSTAALTYVSVAWWTI